MTQLEMAKKGTISLQMKSVAEHEGLTPEFVRQGVESGFCLGAGGPEHWARQSQVVAHLPGHRDDRVFY